MNKNAKAKNVLQGLPFNPCVAEKVVVSVVQVLTSIINELKMTYPPRPRASPTQKARLSLGSGRPPCVHPEQETGGKVQTPVAITFLTSSVFQRNGLRQGRNFSKDKFL